MNNIYKPEGYINEDAESRECASSLASLEAAMKSGRILECRALLCDGEQNLHFDINGIPAVMEKREVQLCTGGEEVKDIAVISRVGRQVCFKVIGIDKSGDGVQVILSRRAAQAECAENYISKLKSGDIIDAKITHAEQFGVFCDIGCGIIALLPIDSISVSRISHPCERLFIGEETKLVVKSISSDTGRIFVTRKELLGTWEENAELFAPLQTVIGTVRSVESYGVFVELTPNLAGLAEYRDDVSPGQSVSVFIKSIIPEKMKVKLVIIDTHAIPPPRRSDRLFTDTETVSHIDFWKYSPGVCERQVVSLFPEPEF